jgi:hypothetical protein
MLLRIEQGKGRKDRFAMLSPLLLELLRDWYRIALSDAGHRASRIAAIGRHPKPSTKADISREYALGRVLIKLRLRSVSEPVAVGRGRVMRPAASSRITPSIAA